MRAETEKAVFSLLEEHFQRHYPPYHSFFSWAYSKNDVDGDTASALFQVGLTFKQIAEAVAPRLNRDNSCSFREEVRSILEEHTPFEPTKDNPIEKCGEGAGRRYWKIVWPERFPKPPAIEGEWERWSDGVGPIKCQPNGTFVIDGRTFSQTDEADLPYDLTGSIKKPAGEGQVLVAHGRDLIWRYVYHRFYWWYGNSLVHPICFVR